MCIDLSDDISKECMWYCFSGLIQDDLAQVMEHWNTHYIRKSRHDTVAGRPESLFHLPESFGGVEGKCALPETDLVHARENFTTRKENNEYTEYFNYHHGHI